MVLFKPGYHVSPSDSGNNWYCLSATLTEKFVFHFTVSNRKYKTRFYFSLYFLAGRDIGDLAEVGSAECLCWFRSDRLCIIWQEHKHQVCPGLPLSPDKITAGSQLGDSLRLSYSQHLLFFPTRWDISVCWQEGRPCQYSCLDSLLPHTLMRIMGAGTDHRSYQETRWGCWSSVLDFTLAWPGTRSS